MYFKLYCLQNIELLMVLLATQYFTFFHIMLYLTHGIQNCSFKRNEAELFLHNNH